MKKFSPKINIITVALMAISIIFTLNVGKVNAFDQTKTTISGSVVLPDRINSLNGIGTGTITLGSDITGYDISYQKIDISESTYDKLSEDNEEIQQLIKTITEESNSLDDIKEKSKEIQNSTTATDEEKDNIEEEYADVVKKLQEDNEKYEKKRDSFAKEIPDYNESSWTKTTSGTDNLKLDFSGKTGDIYFVLWAKAQSGTDTKYNVNVYTSNIQSTDDDNDDNNKGNTDNTKDDETKDNNAEDKNKSNGGSTSDKFTEEKNTKDDSKKSTKDQSTTGSQAKATNDDTTAKTALPNTGASIVAIIVISLIALGGTFAYVGYRRNNF